MIPMLVKYHQLCISPWAIFFILSAFAAFTLVISNYVVAEEALRDSKQLTS